MKVALQFDQALIEDIRMELARWQESAAAGDMDGDELLSRLGDIAELLDDAYAHLRRALGR